MLKRMLVISLIALVAVVPAFNTQGIALRTGKGQPEQKKSIVQSSSYKNYLNLPSEWADYGIGDPYVFRINGNYYLYCSTKDGEIGVKAWTSTDLINWKYEGLVTKDAITQGAYAPEVVYWNGYYYMYTSPEGNGHYALRSTSPIGPFKVVTNNFGESIDGDVFIDDNGKWYFNHAGQNGIVQNPMINPLTVDDGGGTILDSTNMNGWTEGPGIIKRNGKYFITYTGNHVQSDGYRVNYSVSAEGPSSGYRAGENNPLIISTDEDYNGLGHSSTVLGPDMDSYYLIYHNRIGANAAGAPSRKLNIARLVFNGDKMSIVGANTSEQPVPKTADFFTWVNKDGASKNFTTSKVENTQFLISKRATDKNYIAEFNYRLASDKDIKANPKLEFIFSYVDSKNYMSLSLNLLKKDITLNNVKDGNAQIIKNSSLFSGIDFTKLHTVRVEKTDNDFVISFDNLKKMSITMNEITGGDIGYAYNKTVPVIGYTAFSNDSSGTSDYNVYKSVPGNIESTHFIKGYNVGYYLNQTSVNGNINVNDISLNHDKLATLDNGSYFMSLKQKGEFLKYNINVAEKAAYGVNINVKGKAEDITVKIYVDDKPVGQSVIPSTNKDHTDKFVEMRFADINLNKGLHTLKIENAGGNLEFKNLSLYKVTEGSINFKDPLTKYLFKNWTQSGFWKANEEGFRSADPDNSKGYTGNHGWTDYEVTTKVTVKQLNSIDEGGIIFRVNNESTGFRQQATDDFTGYYAGIDENGLFVDKLNYNRTMLATKKIKIDLNKEYELKVRAIGNMISVYLGDADTDTDTDTTKPLIEIHDDDVLSSGKVGLYASSNDMYFKDFTVNNITK